MTTRVEAVAYIRALGLSPFVVDLYHGRPVPRWLTLYAACPEEYFMLSEEEQEPYSRGYLMPIIDDGNFDFLTLHDPRTGHFVVMAVEDPVTDSVTLPNWASVLVALLFRINTARTVEEALSFGQYLGLRNPRKHLAFLKSLVGLRFAPREQRIRDYLAAVPHTSALPPNPSLQRTRFARR